MKKVPETSSQKNQNETELAKELAKESMEGDAYVNLDDDPKTVEFIEYVDKRNVQINKVIGDKSWTPIDYNKCGQPFLHLLIHHYIREIREDSMLEAQDFMRNLIEFKKFYPAEALSASHPYKFMTHTDIYRLPVELNADDSASYKLVTWGIFDFSGMDVDTLSEYSRLFEDIRSGKVYYTAYEHKIFFITMWVISYRLSMVNFEAFWKKFKTFQLRTDFKTSATTIFYQVINMWFTAQNISKELQVSFYFGRKMRSLKWFLSFNVIAYLLFMFSLNAVQMGANIYTQIYSSMKSSFFLKHKDLVLSSVIKEKSYYELDLRLLLKLLKVTQYGYKDESYILLNWDKDIEIYTVYIFMIGLVFTFIFDSIIGYNYYTAIYEKNKSFMLLYEGSYYTNGEAKTPMMLSVTTPEMTIHSEHLNMQKYLFQTRIKINQVKQLIKEKVLLKYGQKVYSESRSNADKIKALLIKAEAQKRYDKGLTADVNLINKLDDTLDNIL